MVLVSVVLSSVFGGVFVIRGLRHGSSPFRREGAVAIAGWIIVVLAGPIGDALGTSRVWSVSAVGVVGAALGVVCIALAVWSSAAMGRAWRIGVDPSEHTDLVIGGPFRIVRNPIYVAMMGFAAGVTLLVPNVASIGALVVAVAAINLHVRLVEEPHLARQHRAYYARYAAATGRFVPRVRASLGVWPMTRTSEPRRSAAPAGGPRSE